MARIRKLKQLRCWGSLAIDQEGNKKLNEDGELFVLLARVFEYYMQGRLTTQDCTVLDLYYLFHSNGPEKQSRAVLDIAYWKELVAPFNFPAKATLKDKLAAALPIFAQSLKNAFDFNQITGNWQDIIDDMRAKNFVFSENIKKINQDWSFRWRYIDPWQGVEFYFYNWRKNKEVLMCKQHSSIMPRYWFVGFSLQDDTFKIALRLSDQYWLFDLKTERCRYVHPRAEAGEAHSQYNLARDYLWRADLTQGRHWLEKAAAQGFPRAIKLLERINAPDFDIKRDKRFI